MDYFRLLGFQIKNYEHYRIHVKHVSYRVDAQYMLAVQL